MSVFSSSISIDRSYQCVHCQLSYPSIRSGSIPSSYHHVKSSTTTADNHISGYKHFENKPLAVKVSYSPSSIQPWSWFTPIPSVTAVASAGRTPMVGNFIDISRTQQPQSCLCAQCAQWNSVLQWAYPHPHHVKKHIGSITAATSSSMGPLCTQACSYPIKDSDRAVCYSLATSLFDHTVLSSISLSSPMWLQIIKSSVGSSEQVAGICRSVWSCVSDSMFGPWCDPTSPGKARPSSACAGGYCVPKIWAGPLESQSHPVLTAQ